MGNAASARSMANAKCRSCDHADDAVLTAETGIRLLGVARNPANGFPARLLDAVDMESYRMERRAAQSISLAEEDAEIAPVQPTGAGGAQEPEMDRLSNIITEFNKTWGGKFSDPGRVSEVLNRNRYWRTSSTRMPGRTRAGRTPRSSWTPPSGNW